LSVENFNTHNLPVHNVQYQQRPFAQQQAHISVPGAVTAFRLGLRVKRATTDVAPTAATVVNSQGVNLGSQFGFALLDEKLAKLGCERGERIGEERSVFVVYRYWMF